jgi:DUF917 family protein
MFSIESEHNVEDLVVGTMILASAGGGSPEACRELLESGLSGKKIRLVRMDEIREESWIVSPTGSYT